MPGGRLLFVPGGGPVDRRLFVFVKPFHARHIREIKQLFIVNPRILSPVQWLLVSDLSPAIWAATRIIYQTAIDHYMVYPRNLVAGSNNRAP